MSESIILLSKQLTDSNFNSTRFISIWYGHDLR
jgi:hypothetical protein